MSELTADGILRRVRTDRLREIAHAIADGNRDELTMRVPAEPDRDADLVIMSAAEELDALRAELAAARAREYQMRRSWAHLMSFERRRKGRRGGHQRSHREQGMTSLWVVTNSYGPDHVCELRKQAMEHAAEMAGDFPQLNPWNVTEYVPASELAAAKAREFTREQLMAAIACERESCAIAVWMTLQDALSVDADDKGIDGWMREAESRIKARAAIDPAIGSKG